MDSEKRDEQAERELFVAMEPAVQDGLKYLVGDKRKWWPSQFFDFMKLNDDECIKGLIKLRKEVRALSNEELVVLIGNGITEEALPNYSRRLTSLFPDQTGVSIRPWSVWGRNWDAEEKTHGMTIDRVLILSERIDNRSRDGSTIFLIGSGMYNVPGLLRGLLYPTFQEPFTSCSHMNMAKLAEKRGAQTIYEMCSNIAKDEARHAAFYRDMVMEMMRLDPNRTLIEYQKLMKDKVVMPAVNMIDETNKEPPTLFEHFAGVASRIGVFTAHDYATITRNLNKVFGIGSVNVSGEAAEAQEYLCGLPDRLDRVAGLVSRRVIEPVAFDWIYGGKA